MRSFFATLIKLVIPGGAGPNSDRIEIGGELPADLVTYYTSNSYTTIGGIVMFHPANEYDYIILALNASGVATLCIGVKNASGIVDAIQVRPSGGLALPRVTFGEFNDNPGLIIVESLWTLIAAAGAQFDWPGMRHVEDSQLTASTTSSTTYANLTNICGVSFTAPSSGIVTLHYATRLSNNSAAGGAIMTPWVGTGSTVGSGTEFLASADANAILFFQHSTASEDLRNGASCIVTGLSAGTVYNVSMRARATSGGGTASFDDTTVVVVPSP